MAFDALAQDARWAPVGSHARERADSRSVEAATELGTGAGTKSVLAPVCVGGSRATQRPFRRRGRKADPRRRTCAGSDPSQASWLPQSLLRRDALEGPDLHFTPRGEVYDASKRVGLPRACRCRRGRGARRRRLRAGDRSARSSRRTLAAQTTQPSTPDELAAAVKRAFETRAVDALLGLFYWEGVDEPTRASLERVLGKDVQAGYGVAAVTIRDPDPDDITRYTLGGVTYEPNLPVVKELEVRFEPNPAGATSDELKVGTSNGVYYLVTATPVASR
jgi:hypothetical protein